MTEGFTWQALNALAFFFKHVLGVEEPVFGVRLKKTGARIPVVLSPPETRQLLEEMDGQDERYGLIADILVGAARGQDFAICESHRHVRFPIDDWGCLIFDLFVIAMTPQVLEECLIDFAVRIVSVVESLPNSRAGNHIAKQLVLTAPLQCQIKNQISTFVNENRGAHGFGCFRRSRYPRILKVELPQDRDSLATAGIQWRCFLDFTWGGPLVLGHS